MGNRIKSEIVELRSYVDPQNPDTSDYSTLLPETPTKAVFDPETGETLDKTLAALNSDNAQQSVKEHDADPAAHSDIREALGKKADKTDIPAAVDLGAHNTATDAHANRFNNYVTTQTFNSRVEQIESTTAAASVAVPATLTAAGWSGSGPYSQTLSIARLQAGSHGFVMLAEAATASEADAFLDAEIGKITQAAGSMTVWSYGSKPQSNIPVTVLIVG